MNNVHITEYDVCKGRNKNMDPHKCIIDTGCPKTVTGWRWMNVYAEPRGEYTEMKTGKENESFRFSSSEIYKSKVYYEIEVEMNNLKERIEV